jgi:putative hydrolase of the HAD superfamily
VYDLVPPDGASGGQTQAPALARRLAQPQSVRAVFFDVGYTLLAPHPSVLDIVSQVCADRGQPVSRACLESQLPEAQAYLRAEVRGAPQTWADDRAITAIWAGYFAVLLRACLDASAPSFDETVAAVRQVYEHHTSYAVFPDVVPVLRLLHARGLTLGVISDWGIGLGTILHQHGLNQYFDFAVVSAALRHAKPHPWLFETALRRANTIADYALHIGDSYVLDVLGARAAGIEAVLIDRPGTLDSATVDVPVVRDLYGLLDLLEVEGAALDELGGA